MTNGRHSGRTNAGRMSIDQCKAIAQEATKSALNGLPKHPEWLTPDLLVLGAELHDDNWVFLVYLPGETSNDAIVFSETRVNRLTGDTHVQAWPERWLDLPRR